MQVALRRTFKDEEEESRPFAFYFQICDLFSLLNMVRIEGPK
jgi:hypothetical protein